MDRKVGLYSLLVLLLALVSYFYVDIVVADYFNHIKGPIKTLFSQYITKLGKSEWILILSIALYLIYRTKKPSLAQKGLFIFASIALSGILVNILKMIFSRYRPKAYFNDNLFGFDLFGFQTEYIYNSFPSGHSVTAMGLAIAMTLLMPKHKIWFLLFGVIVASSRFIITAHYMSDVLVGGLLGGLVSYYLYHKYFKLKIGI